MQRRFRNQAGDTIVEVVIAVAVVATILAGAFVVTNRSTQAVRDSEEHAQALQYLQGQVELLRAAAASSGALSAANISAPFCFDNALALHAAGSTSCAGAGGAIPYSFSISCSVPPSKGCPAPQYNVTTFTLTATWPSISGGTDAVYLAYEVEVTP